MIWEGVGGGQRKVNESTERGMKGRTEGGTERGTDGWMEEGRERDGKQQEVC